MPLIVIPDDAPPVLSRSDAIGQLLDELGREAYVADPAIATSLHLAQALQKPLLVEGHAGVGKTEIAKVLAVSLKRRRASKALEALR